MREKKIKRKETAPEKRLRETAGLRVWKFLSTDDPDLPLPLDCGGKSVMAVGYAEILGGDFQMPGEFTDELAVRIFESCAANGKSTQARNKYTAEILYCCTVRKNDIAIYYHSRKKTYHVGIIADDAWERHSGDRYPIQREVEWKARFGRDEFVFRTGCRACRMTIFPLTPAVAVKIAELLKTKEV